MAPDKISSALLYGSGVFTTLAIVNGEPFLIEKHLRRITRDAGKLGIDISGFDPSEVKSALADAISSKSVNSGRARITFGNGSAPAAWSDGNEAGAFLSILVADRRQTPSEWRIGVSPHFVNTTSPLAGVKSCNYLEPLMSHAEVKLRGFDEAIRLNERGEVTSACMANVFWLKDENLFTPSLKTGCLPGTTREYVLENLGCEEVEAGIEAVRKADDIFLTSAGIGIVRVAEFDGKVMKQYPHPISGLLPFTVKV